MGIPEGAGEASAAEAESDLTDSADKLLPGEEDDIAHAEPGHVVVVVSGGAPEPRLAGRVQALETRTFVWAQRSTALRCLKIDLFVKRVCPMPPRVRVSVRRLNDYLRHRAHAAGQSAGLRRGIGHAGHPIRTLVGMGAGVPARSAKANRLQ